MRLRGKLGQEESGGHLVALLIILVTTGVAIFFILDIGKTLDRTASGECAAEVQKAGFVNKVYGREAFKDIENCQTKQVTLKTADLPSDPERANNFVKKAVAEEMRLCWQQWGRGQVDLFNEAGSYCHVCAVITTEQAYDLGVYGQYLETNKSPTGKTYAEELAVVNTRDASKLSEARQYYTPLTTAKPLYVIYWHEKNKQSDKVLQQYTGLVGSTTTTVAGALAGGTLAAAGTAGVAILSAKGLALIGIGTGAVASAGTVVTVATATAAGAAVAGGISYAVWRLNDEWWVLSATYLTPEDPNNIYVQRCQEAATVSQSP
jgi:hypothetical protein